MQIINGNDFDSYEDALSAGINAAIKKLKEGKAMDKKEKWDIIGRWVAISLMYACLGVAIEMIKEDYDVAFFNKR